VQVIVALLALPLAVAGCLQGIVGGGSVGPADYASDKTYKTWVVEVDHSSGAAPDGSLLDFVEGRLNSMVKKDAIEFRQDETLATDGGKAWDDAEVQALAEQHRGLSTGGSQVVTHLLFLTGHSTHDTDKNKVLGVTYGHELIVIFSDTVAASCNPGVLPLLPSCHPADYFRSVVTHEFGHAIGLVDNGAPMVTNHRDPDASHGAHSANKGSVMYYAVESTQGLLLFGNSAPPTDFDDNDRADLRALQ
jgi:hypothetical protein